jgi:hypothetical protein
MAMPTTGLLNSSVDNPIERANERRRNLAKSRSP